MQLANKLNLEKDIRDIASIPIIPAMLDVICKTTKMRFAAVARVTEDRWIACSVKDEIDFGLKPGDELQLQTTICNEIRQSGCEVVIDHVSEDPDFREHHTPAMYGFQSYISIPIFKKDGSFFGTLCSIDPDPNQLKLPEIRNMFRLFADLISFHLDGIDQIDASENKFREERAFAELLEAKIAERTQQLEQNNVVLEKMNKELQSFAYISSHDLQEPLRKIQTFASMIAEKELDNLSEKGKAYFRRMEFAAERMQILINDLLAYSRTGTSESRFETVHLDEVLADVKEDLKEELEDKDADIITENTCEMLIIPFQFRQLLYNLIGNALKFASPGRRPEIRIRCTIGPQFGNPLLQEDKEYCHISVSDNGIGFEQQYGQRIFELFQRLHDRTKYEGTGIGLAIVKKIVENHNGVISATGKMNEGATFDIYIPLKT